MSLSQPYATAASVEAQRKRNANKDAAAIADWEQTYAEYVASSIHTG
jgi:hypothetical protein